MPAILMHNSMMFRELKLPIPWGAAPGYYMAGFQPANDFFDNTWGAAPGYDKPGFQPGT